MYPWYGVYFEFTFSLWKDLFCVQHFYLMAWLLKFWSTSKKIIICHNFINQASSILQPMDKRLSDYIKKVVNEHGVTSTFKMKLLLGVFLRQYIFHNAPMPPKHNKRFWPSLKDIYNHMAAQFLKLRDSRVDQVQLRKICRLFFIN